MNNAHANCSHPSTKLARTTCRNQRTAEVTVTKGVWHLVELTTGYSPRVTAADYDAASRNLIGMGYTCTRVVYDAQDHEVAAFYQHKTNDTMSARLELR